jgi:hypothetical protein
MCVWTTLVQEVAWSMCLPPNDPKVSFRVGRPLLHIILDAVKLDDIDVFGLVADHCVMRICNGALVILPYGCGITNWNIYDLDDELVNVGDFPCYACREIVLGLHVNNTADDYMRLRPPIAPVPTILMT